MIVTAKDQRVTMYLDQSYRHVRHLIILFLYFQTEMQCCRVVVKLCRECLLVVYQFASETRVTSPDKDLEPAKERVTSRLGLLTTVYSR